MYATSTDDPIPKPVVASAAAELDGARKAAARWVFACRLEDIVANTGVCAKVGRRQVAVFRLVSVSGEEEGVYAIDNYEPRSRANVLSRGLVGDLNGEVVVASPVYKNHFCLKTGRCLEEEAHSVRAWPVRVADGMVFVGGAPE